MYVLLDFLQGILKIKKILEDNYVRPDESEKIKSKIRENGKYTIIDKVSVFLDEKEDIYVAEFTNLKIRSFEINSDFVIKHSKLLTGGVWSILNIEYISVEQREEMALNGEGKHVNNKSKYLSPFEIVSLQPIQMPNLNMNEMLSARKNFTKDEWIALLLRSMGYEPDYLSRKQQFHYLLRLAPLVQNNYNLVELGPRGTGKSHVYQELSPYSILMSGGQTTVANLFYNMARKQVGLVGHWDCIAFDEVAGIKFKDLDGIQILKNYMANGSFARGQNTINADASICFVGNTNDTVENMLKYSHLFTPFPEEFNCDSAFFDRIHYYLLGWETPKLRNELITNNYGLISDCLSEYCREMRKYDYNDLIDKYFELNNSFNNSSVAAAKANTITAVGAGTTKLTIKYSNENTSSVNLTVKISGFR